MITGAHFLLDSNDVALGGILRSCFVECPRSPAKINVPRLYRFSISARCRCAILASASTSHGGAPNGTGMATEI